MTGRLVIFDVDDTLLDRAGRFRAWAGVFARARGLGPEALAWLVALDDDGRTPRRRFFEAVHAHFGFADPVEDMVAAYWADQLGRYHCPSETKAALAELRALGWRLGAATNGGRAQLDKLRVCGLDGLLDAIGVSTLVGHAKPDPRIFHAVAAQCGASLEGAWVVGDRADADIAGAVAIGARSAWMRRGRVWAEPAFEPTISVDSVADAVAAILTADVADEVAI